MPANTIVIGFFSVCRCIPIAFDTDCIRSRSIAASIITSGQKRDLEICATSKIATIKINLCFSHFHFIVRHRDSLVHPTVSLKIAFLSHLFRVSCFFFHVRWGCSYRLERFHMLFYRCPRCQESSGSLFSISFAMIHFHVLQRSRIR